MASIDFAFYFSLFRRRFMVFLGTVGLLVLAGLVIIPLLPVSYTATAKILVESPQIPTELARSTVPTGAAERFQIIQEDVLSRQSLLQLAEYLQVYETRPGVTDTYIVDDMLARISIVPTRLDVYGSSAATVFRISFKAATPRLAADVVNRLVDLILQKDVDLRTSRANDTVQFFSAELQRLEGDLARLDGRLLSFRQNNIDALPDSLDFRRNQQIALQQRLLQLAQEDVSLNDRRVALQSFPAPLGSVPLSPQESNLVELQQTLSQQLTVFSETSPTVTALRSRIERLKQQVTGAYGEGGRRDAAPSVPVSANALELNTIASRMEAIKQERVQIGETLAQLQSSIAATPSNETALNSMLREQQNLKAQYDAAVSRLAEASTGQQIELRLKGERLSLVESAVPPQKPGGLSRKVLIAGTLLGALVAGLAVVVVPEFFERRVRRPVELERQLDIRPYITVPYIVTSGERLRRGAAVAMAVCLFGTVPLALFALSQNDAPVDQLVSILLSRTDLAANGSVQHMLSDGARR